MAIALQNFENECTIMADNNCFVINSQYEIMCSSKKYRVDFLICSIYQGKEFKIVVECDGHEFHEKTKQQAIRDKKRDRDLTKNNYTILHFTGSEIWKDPYLCAREALGITFPKFRR
jgi:very-short-patch-repair endonuclease